MCNKSNRTPSKHIGHGLYLCFLGLSARNVAKALSFLHFVKRSHVAVWKWIQKYRPKRISSRRKRVSELMVDGTAIKVGSKMHLVVGCYRVKKQADSRTVHIQEKKHVCGREVYRRLGQGAWKTCSINRFGTWYPQACRFLKLNHHTHSPLGKSIIEGTMHYIKDRTECFDDDFPCSRKKGCNLFHIRNWLSIFVTMHNKEMLNA